MKGVMSVYDMDIRKIIVILIVILLLPILAIDSSIANLMIKAIFHTKDNAIVYLQYCGALAGGFATLIAVYFTIKQTQKIQKDNQIQIIIQNLNEQIKDYDNLYNGIEKLKNEAFDLGHKCKITNKNLNVDSLYKDILVVKSEVLKICGDTLIDKFDLDLSVLSQETYKLTRFELPSGEEILEEYQRILEIIALGLEHIRCVVLDYKNELYKLKYKMIDVKL